MGYLAAKTLLAIGETMALVTPTVKEPLATAQSFWVDAAGAESNVAAHVAALGHSARWFSRLGADALGQRVVGQLRSRGVDTRDVIFDHSHRTGVYFKDPFGSILYYRRGSAASRLTVADADTLIWDQVTVLHVSGITAAISESAAAFLSRIIAVARERRVLVSFDVNYRPSLWESAEAAIPLRTLARRADLVFVGRDEAEILWATQTSDDVRELLAEVPELVVKDSDVGATSYCGSCVTFSPAMQIDVIEPVGAGDAFAGGYLASVMAGLSIAERLRRGHHRATLTLRTTKDFPDRTER